MGAFEEAKEFWQAVGKPLDWDELEVGMILLLEDHCYGRRQKPVIITQIDQNPSGFPTFTFRDATVEEAETMQRPYPVLVAGSRIE